jgi:hypothetical protein
MEPETMDTMNTAKLRSLAYDAQEANAWASAASLYQRAIDAYPPTPGALYKDDLKQLRERQAHCAHMADAVDLDMRSTSDCETCGSDALEIVWNTGEFGGTCCECNRQRYLALYGNPIGFRWIARAATPTLPEGVR